jgi:hypothetical protein
LMQVHQVKTEPQREQRTLAVSITETLSRATEAGGRLEIDRRSPRVRRRTSRPRQVVQRHFAADRPRRARKSFKPASSGRSGCVHIADRRGRPIGFQETIPSCPDRRGSFGRRVIHGAARPPFLDQRDEKRSIPPRRAHPTSRRFHSDRSGQKPFRH